MLLSLINQSVIDLIGDDVWAEPGDGLHVLPREEVSCGIGGGVDQNGPGLVPDPLSDRLRPQLEAVLFIDRNPCRHSPQEAYEIGITGVAWIGEYHLLAPLQENGEDKHHRRRGA